jgi:hypothetical protein
MALGVLQDGGFSANLQTLMQIIKLDLILSRAKLVLLKENLR